VAPGGAVRYFMTASDGQRFPGWWRVTSVDPPTSLAFNDGFAGPERDTRRGHAGHGRSGPARRACGRDADDGAMHIRVARRDGPVDRDGHGRGPHAGRRPDGRAPRERLIDEHRWRTEDESMDHPHETDRFTGSGQNAEHMATHTCSIHEASQRCVPHVSRDGRQKVARRRSKLASKTAGQGHFQPYSACSRNELNQTVNP